MRILIVLFLSLMVRDVFSLRGLYSAEVYILGERDVLSDTEPQVTCTISSIEPAGADVKFVKYIASSEEVAAKFSSWRDNSTAQTFEECADAAAASGSKMFLFDGQKCQISDDVYERSDYCGKDHYQMVYVDVDAAITTVQEKDTDDEFFCNLDWTVSCTTGRCINYLAKNQTSCSVGVTNVHTFDGRYHIMDTNYQVKLEDHMAECVKRGAQPCAPANESSISEFLDDLDEVLDIAIGLNSTDDGDTYKWASGVPMPKNHPGWDEDESFDEQCGRSMDNTVTTFGCQWSDYFCCMVPYYAN